MEQRWDDGADRTHLYAGVPAALWPKMERAKWPVLNQFLVSTEAHPCCICQEPTYWAEWNFLGHLHPGKCAEQMWIEYEAALRGN